MRDLARSDKNELAISDARNGGEAVFYYRTPTTSEEASYQAKMMKRTGGKIVMNIYQTRLEFGLKVLTGFREGDFSYGGKPVSSDATSPNYREDWKRIVEEGASDLVTALALAVFEGARANTGAPDIEMTEGIVEEAPLPKS